jgi:hypothetical protein
MNNSTNVTGRAATIDPAVLARMKKKADDAIDGMKPATKKAVEAGLDLTLTAGRMGIGIAAENSADRSMNGSGRVVRPIVDASTNLLKDKSMECAKPRIDGCVEKTAEGAKSVAHKVIDASYGW